MKIVSLSRQIGSYGDEIALILAEKTGLKLIDQAEIHHLAEDCDPSFRKACSLYERETPKNFLERFFFDEPAYISLFESLNFELAGRGNVILIGRGAQIVLQDVPGVFKVRVVAPFETRVQRVMEEQNLSLEMARDLVQRHGHRRRALVEGIYHRDLSDWALYDIILNTGNLTLEEAAAVLLGALAGVKPVENPEKTSADLKARALAKKIESAIRQVVTPAAFSNINVAVSGPGEITITGAVTDGGSKGQAQKIASGFAGVTKIINNIQASTAFSAY
ncbi:MAG: cytidylate kinase family protein [Pseudomonadota bacterium]